MVRIDIDETSFQQTTLAGEHVRLWCLCGGRLSETNLVEVVVTEQGIQPHEAVQQVTRFLQPLYQQGLLVAMYVDKLALQPMHEMEGSSKLGEAIWQRLTT